VSSVNTELIFYVCLLNSDEYDILPSIESTTNRNPVILVDHKLAVEAWAAQLMFCTAISGLQQWQKTPVFNTEGDFYLFFFSYRILSLPFLVSKID